MTNTEVLIQFKSGLITFIDELINQFPEETDFVLLRIYLKNQYPIEKVMNMFIMKILPLKEMVVQRNENFFLNHCHILDISTTNDEKKVNHFKKLWRADRLDDDDKQIVWKWFDSFIFLTEKYQKLKVSNLDSDEKKHN